MKKRLTLLNYFKKKVSAKSITNNFIFDSLIIKINDNNKFVSATDNFGNNLSENEIGPFEIAEVTEYSFKKITLEVQDKEIITFKKGFYFDSGIGAYLSKKIKIDGKKIIDLTKGERIELNDE